VVHREAFPQRGRLLDQIRVIAGLRTQKRGLDQSVVADAGRSSEQAPPEDIIFTPRFVLGESCASYG
jgi:hypothetical protein